MKHSPSLPDSDPLRCGGRDGKFLAATQFGELPRHSRGTQALGLRNLNQRFVRWAQFPRLKLLADGLDVAPVTFDVDPVNFCNHDCPWCLDARHGNDILPLDLIRSFAEELSTFEMNGTRCEGIILKGGGEPTLHPQFPDVVRALGQSGCDLGLITNGSRLVQSGHREAILECLSFVRVSLDACRPESHQVGHLSRDFDRIVDGIRQLTRERRNAYPVIGLTFIVQPESGNELDGIVPFAEDLGVDYIQLRLAYGEEVGNAIRCPPSQLRELHARMLNLRDSSQRLEVFVSDYLPECVFDESDAAPALPIEHRLKRCHAHVLTAVLTADRWMYGCCEHRNLPQYRLGRLDYPAQSLSHIWSSEHRASVLRRMICAECLPFCTHPVSTYNEAIEEIRQTQGRVSSFS